MLRIMCKSKIQYLVVQDKNLEYSGSISIPEDLLDEADILDGEKVDVVNLNNGKRFSTYIIKVGKGNRVCLNGAASRMGEIGDRLIVMSYVLLEDNIAKRHKVKVVEL